MTLADTIAVAIGAKRSGGWWRTTTAHCHAGGNTRDGLAFRSPDDNPDKLIVHCYSRSCHESVDGLNRARDNLRQAAGLTPWQPSAPGHRAVTDGAERRRKVPAGNLGPKTPDKGAGGDTAAYAAQLWTAAAVSTGQAPAHHPVSRWLADRGLWPLGVPLPETVRWLPREKMPTGKGVRPDSTAAGALVLAMRRLDAPWRTPAKCIWSLSTPTGARRNIGQEDAGTSGPMARTRWPMRYGGMWQRGCVFCAMLPIRQSLRYALAQATTASKRAG